MDIGEAIGIVAAQSIGEPGTQLTMRTFHTGGVVSSALEQSEIVARHSGTVKYHNIETAIKPVVELRGTKQTEGRDNGISRKIVLSRNSQLSLNDENGYEIERHNVPIGATLEVEDEALVEKDCVLLEWDPYYVPILTQVSGTVKFEDIIDNVTAREDIDENTGQRALVIIEYKGEDYLARVEVHCGEGKPCIDIIQGKVVPYQMPTGAHLVVSKGDEVSTGDILARIPREILKAKDIVTGLPRVTELFEARKPKENALISEIDGEVSFEGTSRGMRIIKIKDPVSSMESSPYRVPIGKHIIVQEGDKVIAGESLTDGSIDPSDILHIKGENEVQSYLVDEVQKVYQAFGERINDKHIEAIVRQMMRKVRITSPGATGFLEGDEVNKIIFQRENERVVRSGSEPAKAEPILQGISKAALTTESFISAASFQQTTNVLTKAAISGNCFGRFFQASLPYQGRSVYSPLDVYVAPPILGTVRCFQLLR